MKYIGLPSSQAYAQNQIWQTMACIYEFYLFDKRFSDEKMWKNAISLKFIFIHSVRNLLYPIGKYNNKSMQSKRACMRLASFILLAHPSEVRGVNSHRYTCLLLSDKQKRVYNFIIKEEILFDIF